jgi:hypothetical protein
MEGANSNESKIEVGCNLRGFSEETLRNLFHMIRNLREYERTDTIEFSREFGRYHALVLASKEAQSRANNKEVGSAGKVKGAVKGKGTS